MKEKEICKKLLEGAGITLNGNNPWDINVLNDKFYSRVIQKGSLGLGESYMDGWWSCPDLDEFSHRAFSANLNTIVNRFLLQALPYVLRAKITNLCSPEKSFEVGEVHYNLGNDFYQLMLDSTMTYSCGYWKNAISLEEAQIHKYDLICRKLKLKPGMKILEIGCGWGGFAKYAAFHYAVNVIGLTISKEQALFARENCRNLKQTEFELQDYRNPEFIQENRGTFDRIVSIGMFEHVGWKNYRTFMRTARKLLKHDGLLLLHTIGKDRSGCMTDPWIHKYIFPNSMLPSLKQVASASERLFVMEDWHTFGPYYDRTLMEWFRNFDKNWPEINALDRCQFNDRFYLMWKFYLLSCAGLFRARKAQLWQIVLSPDGVPEGYDSVR